MPAQSGGAIMAEDEPIAPCRSLPGETTVTISEAQLKAMVEALVREADPERIYLFGSQARGEAGEQSDIDLLVVERDGFGAERSRRQEMARLWRLLAPFPGPKDLLVYSLDEVEYRQQGRNNVVARAVREGRLLYERP